MGLSKLKMLTDAAREAGGSLHEVVADVNDKFDFDGKVDAAMAICDYVSFATNRAMAELSALLRQAYKSKIMDIVRMHAGINMTRLSRFTALALIIDRTIDKFIAKHKNFGSEESDIPSFNMLNKNAGMLGDLVIEQLDEMRKSESLVDRAFLGALDVFDDSESMSGTGTRLPAFQIIRNGFGTAANIMLAVKSALDNQLRETGELDSIDQATYESILLQAYPVVVKFAMVTMREVTLLQRENPYMKFCRHAKLEKVDGKYKFSLDVEAILNELPADQRRHPYFDNNNFGCPALVNFGGGSAIKKFYEWFAASAGRTHKLIYSKKKVPDALTVGDSGVVEVGARTPVEIEIDVSGFAERDSGQYEKQAGADVEVA